MWEGGVGAVGTLLQFPPPPSQTFLQPEGRSETGESSFFSPFPLLLYPFLEGVAGDPFGPEFGGGRKKELKCGEKWAGEFQMVC